MTKAENIMTSPARSCTPEDSLVTAVQIMWDADCGCVPVVDADRHVVGMITDRDICMAAQLHNAPLGTETVASVMSKRVYACSEDATLEEVALVMGEKQLRRLPVLDPEERLVGVVSLNDLALAVRNIGLGGDDGISPDDVVETLAAISEHRPNARSAEPH